MSEAVPGNGGARPRAFVTAPPRAVLFLCVHNSARSQMAEGFARAMAPEGCEVWSAGTEPRSVHPLAVEVMKEVGVELTAQTSKGLADVPVDRADTVVVLCGEQDASCPRLESTVRKVSWPLPDPAAAPEVERADAFRRVRDEIKWRVSSLWPRGD